MTESNPVPHNLEAERAVLGAALVNPTAFDIAAGLIDATDFFRKAHSSIWRAMADLRRRDMVVDLVTIRDALAKASPTLYPHYSFWTTPARSRRPMR